MSITKKTPRVYEKITPATVAKFKAEQALHGNGSAAVRKMSTSQLAPGQRAFRIVKKSETVNTLDYIEDTLQQIGADAINRVGKMINSADERIATKNAHFAIEHLRGKAVQRSESKQVRLTIESVLE